MSITIRRTSFVGIALMLVTVVVGPAPAAEASEPDPPCEWTSGRFGYDSTCDGKVLPDPPCNYVIPPGNYIVEIGPGVYVSLWYARGPSSQCRSVKAMISTPFPPPEGVTCYVKVERNYRDPTIGDNDRIYASVPRGEYGVWTRELYDANVSSYAWGYCALPGRPPARGGTSSY